MTPSWFQINILIKNRIFTHFIRTVQWNNDKMYLLFSGRLLSSFFQYNVKSVREIEQLKIVNNYILIHQAHLYALEYISPPPPNGTVMLFCCSCYLLTCIKQYYSLHYLLNLTFSFYIQYTSHLETALVIISTQNIKLLFKQSSKYSFFDAGFLNICQLLVRDTII